jgi:DNA-binding MarR family transcriptional regulator
VLDDHQRSVLRRLTRESAWVREAKRVAAASGSVDFVSVQVLAAMALGTSPTFDGVQSTLEITKPQLSRALQTLRRDKLVAEPPGQYARAKLPPITETGIALLRALAQELARRESTPHD